MRISFDIDDTLICYGVDTACEPGGPPFFLRWWFREPLRRGAVALLQELTRRGWEVWIYTTSSRPPASLKWWLRCYGIRVGRVITEQVYDRQMPLSRFPDRPSKYPPLYGIDLHVDDSEGVAMEGEAHGFKVVVVRPDDPDWAQVVLDAADRQMAEGKR